MTFGRSLTGGLVLYFVIHKKSNNIMALVDGEWTSRTSHKGRGESCSFMDVGAKMLH